jgi:branched-subunit amino acid aminotransferase/4-amino-4-deoxychorismate lyase
MISSVHRYNTTCIHSLTKHVVGLQLHRQGCASTVSSRSGVDTPQCIHFGVHQLLTGLHWSCSSRGGPTTVQRASGRTQSTMTPTIAVVASTGSSSVEYLDSTSKCYQSGAWLRDMPRGAYTTARTVRGGREVFELSFHLQRLVDSLELMVGETTSVHALEVKEMALASMRRAVSAYSSYSPGESLCGELKVTVLVHEKDGGFVADTHVTDLVEPVRRKRDGMSTDHQVKVMVRGAPRENAAAKDSDWVVQRKGLEESKPLDFNEVVLVTEDGALYEGLSSNFFVLHGGVLYTAGEGILLGSVREAVLRCAEDMDIPIVLKAPSLDDFDGWDAAFVSSTSRMLLPIDYMSVPDVVPKRERYFDIDSNSMVVELEERVRLDILSNSEPLFD